MTVSEKKSDRSARLVMDARHEGAIRNASLVRHPRTATHRKICSYKPCAYELSRAKRLVLQNSLLDVPSQIAHLGN